MDRRFSASFLTYVLAFAAAGLPPFLLLPFLTRMLNAAEFGSATLFVTLCQLFASFSSFGTHGYVSVRYFNGATRDWGSSVPAAFAIIAALHTVLFVLYVVAGRWIAELLSLPFYALGMVLLASALLCMNFIFLAVYQSSNRPGYYLLARCIQAAGEIGLCLLVLYFFTTGAEARILTLPVAIAAAGLLGLIYCRRVGALRTDDLKNSLKGALRFGLPMLPHVAAVTLVSFLDRLMIASIMGSEELGIYMAASQLGLVMLLVIEPFNKAYAPWLFARLTKNSDAVRAQIVRMTYLVFLFLLLVGFAATAATLFFYDRIVGPQFSAGRHLLPFIIGGIVIQGMYYTVVNYLFFVEKTYILSAISVTTVLTGIAVTFCMTSSFGLTGAAASLAINNAVLFGLVWFFAAREVKLPWFAALSLPTLGKRASR